MPENSDAELKELRSKLEKHLEESGEIRSDLSWLKKAFWVLASAGLTFNGLLAIAILNHFWTK